VGNLDNSIRGIHGFAAKNYVEVSEMDSLIPDFQGC